MLLLYAVCAHCLWGLLCVHHTQQPLVFLLPTPLHSLHTIIALINHTCTPHHPHHHRHHPHMQGHRAVLSSPWYLDWGEYRGGDWQRYYQVEPLDFEGDHDHKVLVMGM